MYQEDGRGGSVEPSVKATESSPHGISLWDFLNSRFGLWFLSAVLLSALPYLWSSWISTQQRKAKVNVEVSRIDLELAYRLRLFRQALLNIENGRVLLTAEKLDQAFTLIEPVAPISPSSYVFPEFRERSVPAMLWEVRSLLGEVDGKEVNGACVAALEMSLFRSNFIANPNERDLRLELQSILSYLEKIWIDRWVYLQFVEEIYE